MFLHKAHLPTSYNLLLFQKTHPPLNSNKNYPYTIQFPLYYQNILFHKSNPISYNHKPLSILRVYRTARFVYCAAGGAEMGAGGSGSLCLR